MSVTVPIETAERDLRGLLERLQLGETITLVGATGAPEALLISLKSAPTKPQSLSDWAARWDALAHKVSQAWKSEKSAVETLAEMRR
jgi:antitoxin (DNA-binding transcriptional repressor) of toxin-antitoxin stability system